LANFSSHLAYISCVDAQKVFEALEDPAWVKAMHEELNNFERNKVWSLAEKPNDYHNVMEQSGCSRTSKMRMELLLGTRLAWLLKGSLKLKALTMERLLHPWLALSPSVSFLPMLHIIISSFYKWM
jgi:hypothetical protein